MIEIDGSYGEGGGQILRTAISLAALTLKPIKISKIRARRPNPGLKRQHMAGIELTAKLVDATVDGLEIGSTEVKFVPRARKSGVFRFDVGTAGSISLILQAVLPAAVMAPGPIEFHLKGGTDVKWSPPVDYFREVFINMVHHLGPEIRLEQKRRGHYPRGGGEVICHVKPVQSLKPISMIEFGDVNRISGISHCVKLPSHVAERQARAAQELIRDKLRIPVDFDVEYYSKNEDRHLGPGSGIVVWADGTKGSRLGADSLGDKGVSAEIVGRRAAEQLVREINSGMAVDSHLCDMIVPYLAIATGESKIGITEITSHLNTNLWTIRQILGTSFDLEGESGQSGVLSIRGK